MNERVQRSVSEGSESKDTEAGRFRPKFLYSTDEIATTLKFLVTKIGRSEPTLTVKQICEELRVSKSTVYKWIEDGSLPTIYFLQLAQLAWDNGNDSLSYMAVPQGQILSPMPEDTLESLDESIAEETEEQGAMRRAVASGNRAEAIRDIGKAKKTLAKQESTVRNMKVRS